MPRRSGTTTVWSFASTAAIGDHMSPVSPKPWISTTAGPWPPTRTLIVASAFTTWELRKSAGKGVGAACADRAPSARLAARPAATRRKRRVANEYGVLTSTPESDETLHFRHDRCRARQLWLRESWKTLLSYSRNFTSSELICSAWVHSRP